MFINCRYDNLYISVRINASYLRFLYFYIYVYLELLDLFSFYILKFSLPITGCHGILFKNPLEDISSLLIHHNLLWGDLRMIIIIRLNVILPEMMIVSFMIEIAMSFT